jgi:serine/threonine-protein kinase
MGSQSDAARLPERFGPFVLERKLAAGGTAEVFVARPSVGQRPAPRFVIKRPLPGRNRDEDYAALSREAELHRAVHHPNVVQVFGAGMVDGQPYLAMEHVDGVDTFRLLRTADTEGRRVPLGVAVYIARCIASALATVHGAVGEHGTLGLVHGDISPSNIYLSLDGDVKLGDFGIARIAEPELDSSATEVKGKWGYVAPEVLEGLPYDHRADLFSLGAVLGELILGESVFAGSSQLAVLLAIREADIEPLQRHASELPAGLFALLSSALSRDPGKRPSTAAELALGLAAFEGMPLEEVRETLAQWVAWAQDPARLAETLAGRARESFARMQATRAVVIADQVGDEPPTGQKPRSVGSQVRRTNGEVLEDVSFARLIEMIATGELAGDDQVALLGERHRPIHEIDELARHLLPSTTTTTGVLFGPGVPDYAARLDETPMLDILARLRERSETGALFVEQSAASGPQSVRKEIYLSGGRLHHVASSAREELLGEYLVRRGRITRAELDAALAELGNHGGRLGDTLVAMRLVEVMDLFRALRDQGRDRVGQLFAWKQGRAAFYRGSEPGAVQFPLDLDLASAMMSGAIIASDGRPDILLPRPWARLVPGPRAAAANDKRERGTAPSSLQLVPSLLGNAETLDDAVDMLTSARSGGRSVNEREAKAALVVALALGWIAFEN